MANGELRDNFKQAFGELFFGQSGDDTQSPELGEGKAVDENDAWIESLGDGASAPASKYTQAAEPAPAPVAPAAPAPTETFAEPAPEPGYIEAETFSAVLTETDQTPREDTIVTEEEAPVYTAPLGPSSFGTSAGRTYRDDIFVQPQESVSSAPQTTIIGAGTEIEGNVKFAGPAKISGALTGSIQSRDDVISEGRIDGNILAANLYLTQGSVEGDVQTSGTVRLDSASVVVGDLTTKTLDLQGTVNGNITAGDEVVVAGSAVISGDITARSIEIGHGAKLEGRFSIGQGANE